MFAKWSPQQAIRFEGSRDPARRQSPLRATRGRGLVLANDTPLAPVTGPSPEPATRACASSPSFFSTRPGSALGLGGCQPVLVQVHRERVMARAAKHLANREQHAAQRRVHAAVVQRIVDAAV